MTDMVRAHAREQFKALIDAHGDELPLAEAAAWMDAEERALESIDPIMSVLDELAEDIRIPTDAGPIENVARLNHALFHTGGFLGEDEVYDAPENSLLGSVLERRKGLPILLSLVYIEVGRRLGVPLQGIGFPTHFLVSPVGAVPRFFVDPFHEGRVLRTDQLEQWFERILSKTDGRVPPISWWLRPVNGRQFLVRMNNNLKVSYMRRGDLEGALRTVERLLLLTPDVVENRRDRGLLRLELGLEEEGAADVDAYLAARHQIVQHAAQMDD